MRSKVMLEQVCRTKISFNLKASGLLLSDNMDILHTLLARSRTRSLDHFLLNDGYEHFYFLTNNSYGETLLQLLCCPEITMQVNAALLQEFQPSLPNSRLECDAVDDSGAPILFCYLPDIADYRLPKRQGSFPTGHLTHNTQNGGQSRRLPAILYEDYKCLFFV